jgi:hypothetical protein
MISGNAIVMNSAYFCMSPNFYSMKLIAVIAMLKLILRHLQNVWLDVSV